MVLTNVVIGLLQLIITIVFTVLALYIGFIMHSKMFPTIDVERELSQRNIAIAIVVAAMFVAIAVVVESGVTGIAMEISKIIKTGLFTGDGFFIVGVAIVQLVFGIVLAIGAIFLSLKILEKLESDIELFEEIRKGNSAVALEMAGVIIAVAVIIQSGVLGITSTLGKAVCFTGFSPMRRNIANGSDNPNDLLKYVNRGPHLVQKAGLRHEITRNACSGSPVEYVCI